MKVMDLISIPNATSDCNKTKTLFDAIYAVGTSTSKTASSATNGVEEAKSLSTIVNDMEEAKILDTVINAMGEAYKRSRNLITIIKAKELYAIGKEPRPPPLPPGGNSKVQLNELNIINNVLEKAQTKTMDLIGIPKEFEVIARSRELDNIAKAKDPNPATTIHNQIGTKTRNLAIIKNLATVKTLDVAKNRNPGET